MTAGGPGTDVVPLVLGESLIDVVVRPDGSTESHVGGAAANVAIGLQRLGQRVLLATHTGTDAEGLRIRGLLRREGVAVREVHVDAGHGAFIATAQLDGAGSARYTFDVDWRMHLTTLPRPDVVHTGCLATTLEPGRSEVLRYLRAVRPSATISYDLNIRPAAIDDAAATRDVIEQTVAVSDVVKASDDDLAWFAPGIDPMAIATGWASRGATVIVTRGAAGATVITPSGRADVPAPRTRVVDTIGAGDAFCASVIASLAALRLVGARRRDQFSSTPLDTWREIAATAAVAAAITVARPGADPPTLDALDDALAAQRSGAV